MAAVVVAADRSVLAIASWILATVRVVFASASWALRSLVSAVARTSPFLTVAPTAALTSVTVQVVDPASVAAAPARWAGAPNEAP